SPALESLERSSLERGIDQLAPIRLAGGGKIVGRQRSVVGRHVGKMPRDRAAANRLGGQLRARPSSGGAGGRACRDPCTQARPDASGTRGPATSRSEAISASGTSTNARSNRRECGSVKSGSRNVTSS